jgi:chromosome segregation ATPase
MKGHLVLVLFALSSCGDASRTSTRDLADVADANSRTSLMRIEELRSEVEQLSSDKDDLERKVRELEASDEQIRSWSGEIAQKHNQLSDKFWRYQKENEQRFGRLGQQWTLL